jgi:hypothetical protein
MVEGDIMPILVGDEVLVSLVSPQFSQVEKWGVIEKILGPKRYRVKFSGLIYGEYDSTRILENMSEKRRSYRKINVTSQ